MISHTVYGCSTTVSYVYSTLVILRCLNRQRSEPVCLRGGGGGGDHNDQHKSEIARGDRR